MVISGHEAGRGGNARVKWGQEMPGDAEFQEVALGQAAHLNHRKPPPEPSDQLLARRARSGGGSNHFADSMSNPGGAMAGGSMLPSIGQGQSNSYPNSTNGRGRVAAHPAYNMAGVSPPSSLTAQQIMLQQGQRANSAGLAHGRVDWKAKYLK